MSPEPTTPTREELLADCDALLNICQDNPNTCGFKVARALKQHLTSEPAGPKVVAAARACVDAINARIDDEGTFLGLDLALAQSFTTLETALETKAEPEPAASVPVTREQAITAGVEAVRKFYAEWEKKNVRGKPSNDRDIVAAITDAILALLAASTGAGGAVGPSAPEWLPITLAPDYVRKQAEASLPKLGELVYQIFMHHDGSLWLVQFSNPSPCRPLAAIQINRPKDPQP